MALVAPMTRRGNTVGRKRSVNVREILNGIFYVLWTECQRKDCRERRPRTIRPPRAALGHRPGAALRVAPLVWPLDLLNTYGTPGPILDTPSQKFLSQARTTGAETDWEDG